MSRAPTRNWSDEQISAFLDGELGPVETEALARDVEADAALASRVERLGAATRAFVAAANEVDHAPMSDGLKAVLAAPPSAKVIPFRSGSIPALLMEHRAIAAALICAVAVWGVASGTKPQGMFEPGDGGVIVASSPLHRALETGASSEVVQVAADVSVTPRLTFASDTGYCRQFDVSTGSGATSVIACREDGVWRTQVAVFGKAGDSDYQTASGAKSPMLEAFIDKHIAGAPLNAADEAKVISNNWVGPGR